MRKIVEAINQAGLVDVQSLSGLTGLPRERVELLLVMLEDLKVLSLKEGRPSCLKACENCPLAGICRDKNLRVYTLKE